MTGPIARGTIRTTFVLGLRLAVQAGTLLLVARMLGPDEFGAFAGVAALAVMLGTLSTFGTHLVLLGEVSKEPARRAQVLPWAVPFTLLCGGALLVAYFAICVLLFGKAVAPWTVLVAIGTTETLLQPLFRLPASEHLALGRVARSQLLTTLPLALRLIAATVVFLLGPSDPLTLYGYGYFAASLIALSIAIATLPAPWPRVRDWRLPHRAELKEAAGYGTLAITAAGPAELDKTLATKLLPLAASGLYAAGARVIGATALPVIAMMLAALPRLFRDSEHQSARTARLLRWIFATALSYSVVLAVVLWFLAPVFVRIFGPKYEGIQHTIHWLTLAVPGMAVRIAAGDVLAAHGKPLTRLGYELGGLILLIAASVAFVPHLGPVGMPLALACAEWSMACTGFLLAIRTHRSR